MKNRNRLLPGAAVVAAKVLDLTGVRVSVATIGRWARGLQDGRRLLAIRVGRLLVVDERDLRTFLHLAGEGDAE